MAFIAHLFSAYPLLGTYMHTTYTYEHMRLLINGSTEHKVSFLFYVTHAELITSCVLSQLFYTLEWLSASACPIIVASTEHKKHIRVIIHIDELL